VGEYNLLTHN